MIRRGRFRGELLILLCLVCQKIVLITVAGWGLRLVGNDLELSRALSPWDSEHYLRLAREGYTPGEASCAFYPLLPSLISALAPFFGGSHLAAGFALTNLAGIGAVMLFFKLIKEQYGERTSTFATIALLVFPTAFFFSVIYTESVFFLELMFVFWGIRTNQWRLAAAAAFFMPLTKAIGLFIALPLAWRWFALRATGRFGTVRENGWLLASFSAVAGFLICLMTFWLWTGDPFESFHAQKYFPYRPSIANMGRIGKWGAAFLNWGTLYGAKNSIFDRSFFLLFLVSLYWIWKLDRLFFLWSLLAGLVPALSNCFFSYTRYILCVFPIFILAGIIVSTSRRSWIFWYYCILMMALQCLLMVRFLNHLWAG